MFLDQTTFTTVIEYTPLVSIDLVVVNSHGHALLGKRLNRPAQGFWFVPGGRILKNESLSSAFKRLTRDELGVELSIEEAKLLGPFDHFYTDYVFGDDVSTHYVAIAYFLELDFDLKSLPIEVQHDSYRWFDFDTLFADRKVHANTKSYFTLTKKQTY